MSNKNGAMELYINSIKNNSTEIEVKLIEGEEVIMERTLEAQYRQSEQLLPLISQVLYENGKSGEELQEIRVENQGGTFTSVRIGVIVANALGYAWGIPVKGTSERELEKEVNGITITQPAYNKEPNITV